MHTRKFFTLSVFLILITQTMSQNLFSQNLLKDDFSYPVNYSLEEIGGWNRTGSNTANNVKIISPGLTFPGYAGSGISNTTYFSNNAEGDILQHFITSQTTENL